MAFWYDGFMNYFEKYREFPLTYTLIVLNVLVFLLATVSPSLEEPLYVNGVLQGFYVVVRDEHYRLLTSIFMHSGGTHIVMNMLSLYMVGRMVERLFSKSAYLSLYFLTAFFGAYASIYMHLEGQAVGASGAIFGLFGALAGFVLVHRQRMQEQFMQFMKDFGIILLINLGIGIAFPSVDISAHVGGLLSGIIGGMLLAKSPKLLPVFIIVSFVLFYMIDQYIYTLYATSYIY